MLNEQEKTLLRFEKAFAEQQNKRIVIYGTGINAEAIIKNVADYQIIGLMDAAKTGSICWGLPVFSYEEVLENKADFIVIVARPSVLSVIYTRISDFVETNQIPVYDIDGNDVRVLCQKREKTNPYFAVSKEDLLAKIEQYPAVSFDIFDTLMMRKVLYPTDVFEIMSKDLEERYSFDFVEERISAEQEIIQNGQNPTIHEIYQCLAKKNGLDSQEQEELLKKEIETERKVLLPRKEMVAIFRKCIKENKRVYLVSDMYLTSDILEALLAKCGIEGYSKLIISCEYGSSKEEGLFDVIKGELAGVPCLHIGDNQCADIAGAQRAGLDTFYVMSGREMLENSLQDRLLMDIRTIEQRVFVGLYVARAYNNPFVLYQSKGKLLVEDAQDVGYLFVAPLLLGFVFWMSNELQGRGIRKILFGARDGYLMQKLYHICCDYWRQEECENQYILISRRNVSMCAIEDEQDVLDMLDAYQGSEKRLNELFGIDFQAISLDVGNSMNSLDEFVLSKMQDIKIQAGVERSFYLRYLNAEEKSWKDTAFFDFMSKGTCHLKLQKVLNTELLGLYFQKSESKDCKRNALAFSSFCDAGSAFERNYAIFKYCDFLETIVTDLNPSFWGYSREGQELFYPEKRDEKHLKWICDVHKEILKYAESFLEIYPYPVVLEYAFYDNIFRLIDPEYSVLDNIYEELHMYDGYSDKSVDIGELFKKVD